MHEIDFLPDEYRLQQATRHNNLWRLIVLCMFTGLVTLGGLTKFQQLNAKRRQLRDAQAQTKLVREQTAALEALRGEARAVRPFAELVAFVDHPWPRTQVIGALLRRLPESITLDEIHIHRLTNLAGAPRPPRRTPRQAESPNQAPQISPAEADLAHLRQLADLSDVVVSISGVTREHGELHRYLSDLGRIPLFTSVELQDVGSLDPKRNAFPFSVQLTLRRGHGQPGPRETTKRMALRRIPSSPPPLAISPPAAPRLTPRGVSFYGAF